MTVTVSPMNPRNTHHVKLSNGVTDVGLILCDPSGNANPRAFRSDPIQRQSIKMYSGAQRHDDLEPPWGDVAQDDFSGGRGGQKYEEDTSKYWDSRQVDTTNGGFAVLAPMEIFDRYSSSAPKNRNSFWPIYTSSTFSRIAYTRQKLYTTTRYLATSFIPAADYSAAYIYFYAKALGVPDSATLTVSLYTNSGGEPDTLLDSDTVTVTTELRLHAAEVTPGSCALTAATTYWLVFNGAAADDANNCFTIICSSTAGASISSDGATWTASTGYSPYYRIEETGTEFQSHFAELKGSLYCVANYMTTATSKIWKCGTSGTATAGAAGYIRDSNNSSLITDDLYNGGVIRIHQGTGHQVPSPWRYISDTLTANSEIQVTPSWGLTPDNTSWYVVLASDRWNEVTGHGLGVGGHMTDVLSVNGALYVACGPANVIRRLRNFWTGAAYFTWTDETLYATMLEKLVDAATTEIWMANRTLPSAVQKAAGLDCTGTGAVAALTGSTINVGDLGEKITGLCIYGEETPTLYVFKEGSIHKLIAEVPQELRISGMREAADERNGHASGVNGVYLYFSFLDSIQRYYSGSLDNISPNRDGGVPYDRRGMASSFVSYPGILYASIDGGNSNYSSIIAWNGQGWHEVWRAPVAGKRIYGNMYIQPVPGDNVDRLYFSWNGNIVSLPVAGNPYELNGMVATEAFQYYCYAPGGSIETSWYHFGLENVDKLFNSITVVGENMASASSAIFLDYKLDDDETWTDLGEVTFSGDVGEVLLDSSTYNISGKRIRVRVRMETMFNNSTPKLTAVIVEGLITLPSKQKVTMTFRLEDNAYDLLDQPEDYTDADTKLAQIRTFAASAGTVGMSGCIDELDGKRVKLDYPSLRIVQHKVEEVGVQKMNRYVVEVGCWIIS